MRVVDEQEHRHPLRRDRQKPQHCRRNEQAIAAHRRREPESSVQRSRIPLRQRLHKLPQRPDELEQSGKRELRLGLDTPHPQDANPLRPRRRVVEQRRLPDPGLAADDERTSEPLPHPRKHRVELRPLRLTPDEHRDDRNALVDARLNSPRAASSSQGKALRRIRAEAPPMATHAGEEAAHDFMARARPARCVSSPPPSPCT